MKRIPRRPCSCGRCGRPPVAGSPPCWGQARTQLTPSTSISTSRATELATTTAFASSAPSWMEAKRPRTWAGLSADQGPLGLATGCEGPGATAIAAASSTLPSKMRRITRVSALELGEYNIRVNSVNPTVVMTEMSAFYWGRPEIGDPLLSGCRLATGRRTRSLRRSCFCWGDGASMITGVSLPIDGGATCC
jgi:Enoyl-(Acyl carrier protein) reductase